MDFTETEVVEVRLRYGRCTYSEQNDINTEHLFIVSLKTTKTERKKSQHPPGVDRGFFDMQTCPLRTVLSEHYMDEAEKTNIITTN